MIVWEKKGGHQLVLKDGHKVEVHSATVPHSEPFEHQYPDKPDLLPWEPDMAVPSGVALHVDKQVVAKPGAPVFSNVNAEVKAATASVKVTKAGKDKQEPVSTDDTLYKVISTIPLANIGFKAAQTVNLGNYESCKIEISVHLPCLVQEIDDTYKFANEWVDAKMGAIMKEVQAAKQG